MGQSHVLYVCRLVCRTPLLPPACHARSAACSERRPLLKPGLLPFLGMQPVKNLLSH
jgi:hypothetical protein